ncbi:RecQ family ATP-dependent DNA helicase [Ichthyenterobacterium magnum]|uniref:ATP-dependent DNA helicase RecQ n=1 Tax=Ichthyenterobacterium magnum TaxID=1230530 RepID=A0A420DL20_9FLAO|nr:RecQ family ATP-dependent DNA helicase [Ichthyenterobacterium magnum]RKE94933.1 ATP-dependent DNA helicase RecQ [Ichthyenterobacterium magnum]
MSHPIEILERYWNHTSFRPLQEDIINAVLDNEDTFALLPTGGGKSICFQIPALIKEGICIVVSPLVALMKDQVTQLQQKGIKAMAITSGISYTELDSLLDNCIYGNYKFLYLSPERLQQDIVQQRIKQMNVNLIAVDEAHCISQWGNDFRPAYKNITILRQLHPTTNVIALTATAKPIVVEEVIKELDFIAPKLFKASFNRPNIAYHVLSTEDKNYKIEQILKTYKGASIIYVRSRKATIEIHNYLEAKGFSSTFFHGGINTKEKQDRLYQWTNNQKKIMVATNAFGMGIDKPDVETIIHINLPESLESYYQEAGRAGRNNSKAYAILLKNNADESRLKNQFLNTLPSIDFIKLVYRKLCNYFQISYGEGVSSTHQFYFNDFCKVYEFNTTKAFKALQTLDRNSIIKLSQQFNYQTKLQFIVSNNTLLNYIENNKQFEIIVKSILRTYGGIFEHQLKINLTLIATKASTTENIVLSTLQQLKKDNIIEFHFSNTDSEITFLQPREDEKTINRIASVVEQQLNLKKEQIKAVINYINNNTTCKNIQLLNYFGEDFKANCGKCSVCRDKENTTKTVNLKTIENNIVFALEKAQLNSRELVEQLNYNEAEVLKVLQLMIEHQIIEITFANTYKLKHI